jgi:hypothetical protein
MSITTLLGGIGIGIEGEVVMVLATIIERGQDLGIAMEWIGEVVGSFIATRELSWTT